MKQKPEKITVESVFKDFIKIKSLTVTPQSIDNYIYGYQVFCSEVGIMGDESITVITKQLYEEWKYQRLISSSPVSSSNQYLSTVRTFIYWCQEKEYLPVFSLKLIRQDYSTVIKKYTEPEIRLLLQKPLRTDKFHRWRDWLLANIIMGTGARIGSITHLKKEDITDNTIIFTHSKTHKIITLPLSPTLKKAIDCYYGIWDVNSDYVICNQSGGKADEQSLRNSFQQYCEQRGVPYRGFHALRHSMAYLMWKNGTDLLTIQFYLAHSKLEMTRYYIGQLTQEDVTGTPTPLDYLVGKPDKKIKHK